LQALYDVLLPVQLLILSLASLPQACQLLPGFIIKYASSTASMEKEV
jgi:hypothetical protein